MNRRFSSRQVALTATFLALAAGGAAACDASSSGDDWDGTTMDSYQPTTVDGSGTLDDEPVEVEDEEPADEVFYCADEDGEIVAEEYCDDDGGTSSYFLWHSSGYARGLTPGTVLDGGYYFPAGDRASRKMFKLPSTGRVANGTIKTNVVGRGSDSSSSGHGSSGG